nr:MAG TPA: hypothetical protein [Caudoviricetes sp.]
MTRFLFELHNRALLRSNHAAYTNVLPDPRSRVRARLCAK